MGKAIFLLFLGCYLPIVVWAQPLFQASVLQTKNGLPSNRIYKTIKGPKGNLIIATNNGLCLYDGYRFIKNPYLHNSIRELTYRNGNFYFYASEKGLCSIQNILDSVSIISPVNFYDSIPDNDHYEQIFADSKNRIWCLGTNKIKFYAPKFHKEISYSWHSERAHQKRFLQFFEPRNGEIWLVSDKGIWIWNESEKIFNLYSDEKVSSLNYVAAFFDGLHTFYLATKDNRFFKYNIINANLYDLPPLPDNRMPLIIKQSLKEYQKKLFLSDKENIYALDLEKKTYQLCYDSKGNGIYDFQLMDSLSLIWVATGHGLIKLNKSPESLIRIHLPIKTGNVITSVLSDNSGHIWLSAGNSIVWKLNPEGKLLSFKLPNKQTRCLSLTLNNQFILVSTSNGLFTLKQGRFEKLKLQGLTNKTILKAIIDSQNNLWVLTEKGLRVFEWPSLKLKSNYIRNTASFWQINKINDLIQNSDGVIWFAAWMPRSFGIAYFDSKTHTIKSIENQNERALFMGDYYNRVVLGKNGNLWFSGFGGWNEVGLDKKIKRRFITAQYEVNGTEVQGITGKDSGKVWFATAEGLYVYDTKINRAFRLSKVDGLPTNDFTNGFCQLPNDKLALGIKDGILIIDQKKILKPSLINKISLTAIRLNGLLKTVSDNQINLKKNTSDLYIYFSALTFSPDEKVNYRYRFSEDKKWTYLGNVPKLHFTHLEYGDYKIIIQTGDNFGHWERNQLLLSLDVPPPFYKTFWFICLIGALTGFLVFGINRYLYRQHQFKMQMAQQLRDSQISVLRNQMNPHFLFNTLNSINSYIIRHKTEDASDYLTMFSRLMRNILVYSQKSSISLKKELDSLKLYLELEGARLNHSFDYAIHLEKELDSEQIQIPPLIMQPFVENAIWHGLRNKKEEGNIDIKIQEISFQKLKIVITDNGIGRVAASLINKSKHQSLGIEITKKHLKMLNEENEIKIIDLYDEWHQPKGTEVVIFLNL